MLVLEKLGLEIVFLMVMVYINLLMVARTGKHMGLEKSQQISRIIIHPDNNNIIYVAAQGAVNGPTKERGVYKSTDGGTNWKKVLFQCV